MPNTEPAAEQAAIIHRLEQGKLVPVIVLDHAKDGAPLAEALIEGGLPVAEVTMRTPAALDAMKAINQYPDILLGAGTVLHCRSSRSSSRMRCKIHHLPRHS